MIGRGGRQRPCLSVKHEGQDAAGLGAILPSEARDLFAEQRAAGAEARQHRDILATVHLVGDRRPEHAGAGGKGPQALSGLGIIGIEAAVGMALKDERSEEHTSELQSLMRISYAV